MNTNISIEVNTLLRPILHAFEIHDRLFDLLQSSALTASSEKEQI